MDRLIKRGRSQEPTALPPSAGGLAVLLVGLSKGARLDLVDGQPIHLRVPIGEGILDLVIVGDDTVELPPDIANVLAHAAAVVQVSDEGGF